MSKVPIESSVIDASQVTDTAVNQAIPPMTIGLAILYFVFSLSHLFLLPPDIANIMAGVALTTAVILLILYLRLRRFPLPTKWAYPLSFALYGLVILNSLLHLYLTADPRQTTNLMLAIIGAGFFFMRHRWFALAIGSTLFAWTVVLALLPASSDYIHFGFAMGSAALLALLLHIVRNRNLAHLHQLRLLAEHQTEALQTAVYDTQQELLARQQSDEQFSKAFHLNPLAMSITTFDQGFYVDVNDSYLQLFGFTRDEIISHTALELNIWTKAADRQKFTTALQENGYVTAVPFKSRTKAGTELDVLIYAETLNVREERFILGIVYNITEQKKAENVIRKSEQKYRRLYNKAQRQTLEMGLMEQIHVALSQELELSTLIRTVVEATADTFGYPLVSLYLLEDDVLYLQHQVGYSNVISEVPISQGVAGRVVQTRQPILIEDAHADPAFLHAISGIVSEVCVPLFDKEKVAGVMILESTMEPLTQADLRLIVALSEQVNIAISRARLYSQVRASEEKYRSLVEQLPVGVYRSTAGPHGRFLMVNPAFVKMFGFADEAEALAVKVSDLYHQPQERQAFTDHLVAQGSLASFELKLKKRNGTPLWGAVTARVVVDQRGQPLHFDCTIEDISERKRTEEILRQTQKLESLGILAGGIAHDFNNLLMAMMTHNSLALLRLEADHRARVPLEKAGKAAERAANLTKQMLAYSGRGQFEIRALNLNEVIEENIHLFEVAVPKQMVLRRELASNLPLIDADAGQVQQVIMNLIMNGVEAVSERPGELSICTKVAEITAENGHHWYHPGNPLAPDHYVMLEVRDNGIGMDAETLSKIFDPFFTTKFTGRGLGLAAVLGIIRGHKGNLEVQSQLGQGTTFKIYFPISQSALSVVNPEDDSQTPLNATEGIVLVIDDEEPVRDAVIDVLETINIASLSAVNGTEGIAIFSENHDYIKLVILDLSMPGLSGTETLTRLQKINPNVPVILSSGYNQSESTQDLAHLNHADFLEKPYKVDDLIAIVQRHWVMEL